MKRNALSEALHRFGKTSSKRISRFSESLRQRLERIRYRPREQSFATIDRDAARLAKLPRPDFIIIGAPKCGTSWLQRALGEHPHIVMVPNEIEYFSAHLDYPLEWYLNHFVRQVRAASFAPDVPRAIGEKSARYCAIAPDRIRLVHRLLPEVKLVLMTRDPVARHWSQAKRYFSKRRFNQLEGGVLAIPREELFDFFERMRPLGEFSTMIANWIEVFPRHQLLIVSQEQALARPRKIFNVVLDHIGVSRNYDPASIKLLRAETNLGPKLSMPADIADHLLTMFASEREKLAELTGESTSIYASTR